jgi:signal transduction histidine kinase
MRRLIRFRRTAVAATLIAVAVLVPTSAWYLTGSRDAARRARSQVRDALEAEIQHLRRDTGRIESRLIALLARETDRPFYHYQSLFHDPRGAAQGLAVVRSPLAVGASDPLVWAHFQIDAAGNVSLPTVNERFPELSTDEGLAEFCAVLGELQNGLVVAGMGSDGTDIEGQRVTVLERQAWEQIHLAEAVYADLTGRESSPSSSPPIGNGDTDSVVVRVGPLRWQTIVLGSGPALAALREVVTPDGLLVQGFAVATEAVVEWIGSGTEFAPTTTDSRLSVPVGDTDWFLVADASPAVSEAERRARQIRSQFRRSFGLSSAAAISAALAVILILAQTDRLARQRARFAAAAAHELRTPLATLQLHSEMLSEGMGDPEHSSEYAKRIAPEVRRLGRVVSNMLDLSRLERGVALAQPEAGDIGEAVASCIERLRPSLATAGLEVALVLDDELPPTIFDHDALCQILDNLLDNAEKHTRELVHRSARVRVMAEDSSIRITVVDNGPGIPRRLRRRLFRPFARHSNDSPGLGLGLAVAKSLAQAQGGDLEFEERSQGAGFRLTLRIA